MLSIPPNRISDRDVPNESAPEQAREKECLNIGELSSVSFSAEYYLRPQLASLTIDKRGAVELGGCQATLLLL